MNNIVTVRKSPQYDMEEVYNTISDIYMSCNGPSVRGKKVLVKPNILSDTPPEKCVCTNHVVIEAMVRYLQDNGATVIIGDSPAIHLRGFRPEKSGILGVCLRTGAEWTDFTSSPSAIKMKNGKIKIASAALEADLIVSMPKFKNHELVYFTGAVKNTLGFVPGFTKGRQHALHQNRESFGRFLIELSEALTPDFFLMDAIYGMEGRGPGQGTPVRIGILLGSTNPLAMDIIASTIAGYNPNDIPTNRYGLSKGIWLRSPDELCYDGPELKSLIIKDFKRIPVTPNTNISIKFIKNRIPALRKLERRPEFIHENCTGCKECIRICPQNAITMHHEIKNHVVLTDKKCIRCFCCSEVCKFNAVRIRLKPFGV